MSLLQTALQRFNDLLAQAQQCGLDYPNAMSVATVNAQGQPSVRTLLLKGVENQALVFYTNKHSRKSDDLAQNQQVALLFYWQCLHQQVLIEGRVTDVSEAEADAYWQTRPLPSRIGAWASQQSQTLAHRADLEQRYADYAAQFADGLVPRPPHWSGYQVMPHRIEFWTEGEFRLHHRECYELNHGVWTLRLLNP
jgi:pyridoxamine 5'-phosphate oxidase